MRYWVFCYDIADNRRRRRLVRVLADAGAQRVQESVFEGWFGSREIAALRLQVCEEIEEGEDSFRCYALPSLSGRRRESIGLAPPAAARRPEWVV